MNPSDLGDDPNACDPQTDSARRVIELAKKYGKPYVPGELSTDREAALTGSEIPSILGENRFETKQGCFFKKAFGVRISDNEALRHGRANEPVAVRKLKELWKAKVYFVDFIRSEKYPFLGGTPDCLAILPDGEGVLVEIKCPLKRSFGDYVPPQYVGQVQTYLELTDLPSALFVQFKPSFRTPVRGFARDEKFVVTTVPRDRYYMALALPVLWDFWKALCHFKQEKLPIVALAATAIKRAWKAHKVPSAKSRLGFVLCCCSLSYEREARSDLPALVDFELDSNKPEFPAPGAPQSKKVDSPGDVSPLALDGRSEGSNWRKRNRSQYESSGDQIVLVVDQ
jgi:hypothetical protein